MLMFKLNPCCLFLFTILCGQNAAYTKCSRLSAHELKKTSEYFSEICDFINLEIACKKARGLTESFNYNPIKLEKWMFNPFQNISTLVLYSDEDKIWKTSKINNYKVVYKCDFGSCLIDFGTEYFFKTSGKWHILSADTSLAATHDATLDDKYEYYNIDETELVPSDKHIDITKDRNFYICNNIHFTFQHIVADDVYANLFCNIDEHTGEFIIRKGAPCVMSFCEDFFNAFTEKFHSVVCGKTYANLFYYMDGYNLKLKENSPKIKSYTDDCFDDFPKKEIVSVEIPDGVIKLGACLNNMVNLEEVSLPDSLEILNSTFNGCRKFVLRSLPSKLREISGLFLEESGICYTSDEIKIKMPDTVEVIEAMFGTESRISTDKQTFSFSKRKKLNQFGGFVFSQSKTIKTISEAIDGFLDYVLYGRIDKFSKSVKVPKFVNRICSYAFGCTNVESITIYNNVKTLDDGFLAHTDNLVYIQYPVNLKDVVRRNIYSRGCLNNTLVSVEYYEVTRYNVNYEVAKLEYLYGVDCDSNSMYCAHFFPVIVKDEYSGNSYKKVFISYGNSGEVFIKKDDIDYNKENGHLELAYIRRNCNKVIISVRDGFGNIQMKYIYDWCEEMYECLPQCPLEPSIPLYTDSDIHRNQIEVDSSITSGYCELPPIPEQLPVIFHEQ